MFFTGEVGSRPPNCTGSARVRAVVRPARPARHRRDLATLARGQEPDRAAARQGVDDRVENLPLHDAYRIEQD